MEARFYWISMTEARTHLINAPVGEAWHYFRIANSRGLQQLFVDRAVHIYRQAHPINFVDQIQDELAE